MRIGFVVNDSLPGMGMPCSGQGLRAWGLIQGLRGRGIDARALVRHATLGARFQRWKDLSVRRFPDWLTIVNHENIGSVLAEFDVVVFHNWGAAANVAKPGGSDVRFVYDFFSATLVEHAFISSEPEYLDRIRRRKHEILEQCDLFFANGPGRRRYAQAYLSSLGIETQVHDIPTSLPWLGDTGGAARRPKPGRCWSAATGRNGPKPSATTCWPRWPGRCPTVPWSRSGRGSITTLAPATGRRAKRQTERPWPAPNRPGRPRTW